MSIGALLCVKGFTVSSFAESVGVSVDRMQSIIAGGQADIGVFWKMAQTLGVSCDDLYHCLRPFKTTGEYVTAAEKLGVTVDQLITAEKSGKIIKMKGV